MRGDDDSHRAVHARKLFDRHDVLDVAHPRAAVFGGKDRAHQPQFAQFLDGFQRELRASSHSMTFGAISRSANSRIDFLSCNCSSLS